MSPTVLRHGLERHPLLSLAALADAAGELPGEHVERRIADAANGADFSMDASGAGDAAAIIRSIETSGNWIMLRFVEQLPRYRALLEALIAELKPVIGAVSAPKGFIFISAPGTLTPFHFDAEYNVLFQVAGDKDFATYPPAPPYLSLAQREAYHSGGRNMLAWQPDYQAQATIHPLRPGEALYVPYATPHWVRAGAAPSISLSMTWQDGWSHAAADALTINPVLRRFGLPAGDIPAWPQKARLRALACRTARRMRIL